MDTMASPPAVAAAAAVAAAVTQTEVKGSRQGSNRNDAVEKGNFTVNTEHAKVMLITLKRKTEKMNCLIIYFNDLSNYL